MDKLRVKLKKENMRTISFLVKKYGERITKVMDNFLDEVKK